MSIRPLDPIEIARESPQKNSDGIFFPTSAGLDYNSKDHPITPNSAIPLQLQNKQSVTSIPVDDPSNNGVTKENDYQDENSCMNCVQNVQNHISSFYLKNKKLIKYILLVVFLCLYLAFLLYGCITHWKETYPLLIITLIVAFFIFYFFVLKPKFGRTFQKNVMKPCKKTFNKVWSLKYVRWGFYGLLVLAIIVFLVVDTADNRWRLVSFLGLVVLILLTFLFSTNPGKVNWRPVIWGLALQFIFGLIILRWSVGSAVFNFLARQVDTFLGYTLAGTSFVYGYLADPPCELKEQLPMVFAFGVLPMIIFFSSFVSILYYLGVMQFLIARIGAFMQVTMGTTAAESLSAAGNIFIGQTEAPLLVKPYLHKLTMSEISAIMTGGFATIAGSVFGVYVSFGACANHLLSASVMSAPAALAVSKLFWPETEKSKTKTNKDVQMGKGEEKNVLEAAGNGASTAIFLVANIIASLIAFLAFLEFFNSVIHWLGAMVGYPELTFQRLMSWLFFPLAFLMGASSDSNQVFKVAELMGIKTFLNEFIAYQKMKEMLDHPTDPISPRAQLLATYALCGFSNIAAIGIQLGGLGAMCPERKSDFARAAVRCLIAGSVACFMTACVAGLLVNEVSDCVGSTANVVENCTAAAI